MKDSKYHKELISIRREKADKLRAMGIDPFGQSFPNDGDIGHIIKNFHYEKKVRVAGRIIRHRNLGKIHFLDLFDITGRVQIMVSEKEIGPEQTIIFHLLDCADFIGVVGEWSFSKSGERTIKAKEITVLCKALRPLPSNI